MRVLAGTLLSFLTVLTVCMSDRSGVVVSALPHVWLQHSSHPPPPLDYNVESLTCNYSILGNDNDVQTNFFFSLSFFQCWVPTNLANSLSGLGFSTEVILGMYLLIGPPHSRSNYRVWCKYREDTMTSPTAIWNFFH